MPRQYLSQRAIEIMRTLNRLGYYFPKNEADLMLLRGLKQKEVLLLHLAQIKKGRWICYLEGKNEDALKAFLKHYRMNYLSAQELGHIRNAFGLREERYKRKYTSHNKTMVEEGMLH